MGWVGVTGAERRRAPRFAAASRIVWNVDGDETIQLDRIRDLSERGALVPTESIPAVGSRIRFEICDDEQRIIACGAARVAWCDAQVGMGIEFLEVETEPEMGVVSHVPPPLPERPSVPPPLPGRKGTLGVPATGRIRIPRTGTAAPAAETVRRVIGIDLGTTYTCVSHMVGGRPQIIPGRTGTNTIPSVVHFGERGVVFVGQRAADRQVLQPERTVYASKRLLGRTYHADVAHDLQSHYAYPLAEAPRQRFGVAVDGSVVSMDTVATHLLGEARRTAEQHLGGSLEGAVVAVSVLAFEERRDAVLRAAREARVSVRAVVSEAMAAALAYGWGRVHTGRLAVWDFGGGQFACTVVDIEDGRFRVVASGGDDRLGGIDFDDLLAGYLFDLAQARVGLSDAPTPRQVARLRGAAEVAKRALSVQTEHEVILADLVEGRDLTVTIPREVFERRSEPLLERAEQAALEVLASAGLVPADVDAVLLVGGATRLPAVQRLVERLFDRPPSRRINPDEAVAMGAAILAAELERGAKPDLEDVPGGEP